MDEPVTREPQVNTSDKDDNRIYKSDLTKLLSGEMEAPAKNHRALAGILAGILVGFVEGGMPHGQEGFERSAAYVGVRVLTGLACAWIPWRYNIFLRGIVFGLVGGIPFYLTFSHNEILRAMLLALFAGLLISYWTERYGVRLRRDRSDEAEE